MFGLRRPYTSQEHLQKQFENQIEYITLQHNKIDNTMRDITLSVPEKEYPFFIKLIQKLEFVKVKESKETDISKQEFLNGFKEAINELNLVKEGKLKGLSAKDLLNEI